jgi:hypothetical protein
LKLTSKKHSEISEIPSGLIRPLVRNAVRKLSRSEFTRYHRGVMLGLTTNLPGLASTVESFEAVIPASRNDKIDREATGAISISR